MLIIFAKSQFSLFDAPVRVQGHVRKDGTVVAPHVRVQKVAPKQPRRSRLDHFIDQRGGASSMASLLAHMTEGQQQRILSEMARLDGRRTPEQVAQLLGIQAAKAPAVQAASAPSPDKPAQEIGQTGDLFAQPEPAKGEAEPEKPAAEPSKEWLENRRAILEAFVESKPGDQRAEAWHRELESINAKLGNTAVTAYKRDEPQQPDMTGWSGGQVVAYELRREYERNRVRFMENRAALAEFKRKIRREAKHIPEDDEKAVMQIDGLVTKVWGTDYDPKVADVTFAPPRGRAEPAKGEAPASRDDGPQEGERNADGLVFHDGRWHREDEPEAQAAPAIVEHVTAKGKTLRGVVRTDLTKDQAKEIDPYTFKKDGGWFIREKHLKAGERTNDANTTDRNAIVDTGDKFADYWANSASASISRDVKAGRVRRVSLGEKTEPAAAPSVAHDPSAPFGVPAGTSKTRRREINAGVAARVAEGGPFTADDLAQFRQYSGNGGCGDSLNEFYTDPAVARAMWDVIGRLGVSHGTALEPSCATGVFLHTAPEGFRVTGVELDPVSSKVAQALHGDRHEIVTASLERFATTDDRQFDVVIGNPPYGPRGFLAKDDKKDIGTAEQYFTDTAADKCRPGGIVALVVPTGILDSRSARGFREGLLRKGQFLGAMRMPNTAFEHSHTEVTTDVVFLRKRGDDVAGALSTVDQDTLKTLGAWDEEFVAGSYFTGRGAGNVLGVMGPGWRAQAGMGDDITVNGSMVGVPEAIAAFEPDPVGAGPAELGMPQVLEALQDEGAKERALSAATRRPYANTAKVGDTKTVDGVTYILQGDPPRWHRVDEFMQDEAIAEAAPIAAEIERAMNGLAIDRPALEAAVRAYVAKHGVPADNAALMAAASVDKSLFRLVGAVDRKGEVSDLVAGRRPRMLEGSFDAVAQTMALEREDGTFTAPELAERLGKSADDVEDQLAADARYALAGPGRWTTMDAYLSGELWPKLDWARTADVPGMADKLAEQARRLEKAIDPKSLDDVDFQLNSAFIPLHVLEAYFNWKNTEGPGANDWTRKNPPVSITFEDGVYTVKGGNEYGDSKLLDKYLNRSGVKKDEKPRVDELNAEFKEWLCGSQYREAVEDLYNRSFRGFVPPVYSDEPMDVPGLATDRDVRNWRWSSLRRSLAVGKGIVADDVGLGKTLGGLMLARMAKVQGSAKRPIIVVPKSVLANWYAESQAWFPGSKVLTIGANFAHGKDGELVGRDDSKGERTRKYHDLTQNDYDFIIISEPAFQELDLDPITKENYYADDFWVQRGEKLGNAGDKRRKAIREKYEQAIAQREFQDRTEAIYFNELGIDMLIGDEMHHQKNLYAARARFGDQVKFLGGQGLSNRALDFNLKCRWVREQNGGKGVHGLTATPTKNSPLEIYSMLSHIAPEAFERIKVRNSEEFLDRFCEFANDKILSTQGDIEDATVVTGFKNLGELREIMDRFIDRRTADQVGLKLPSRDDRMHLVDMTPAQQAIYAELRELAETSADKKDATGDAHIFSIMDKMNKAALDPSLLGGEHAGASSPKYAALAKQCAEGAKEGGQIVFCEYIDSHDKIVAALVDAGFKRSEIGVINAQVAGSAVKRQNIADAFNAGKLKVVVGNATMAEGLNMQKTTTDIHHMDVPWEPATLQQRNGRGLRQGNTREAVRIHTYLSRGSFDGYRYQSVRAKKDWQDLLWSGADRVENLAREGNFSNEEMRIMLAADPEAARAEFEKDKSAAEKRYDAAQRQEANKQFARFQEMSRSYRALKSKDTKSAARLRSQIEAAKTALFNNKYFPAKTALDSDTDVLVHPQSGVALHAGVGMDFGADGRMVVTGVNTRAGTVTMRRYADIGGGRPVTVPMAEVGDGQSFKVDEKAEADEVGQALASKAASELNSLTKWEQVGSMPSAVLEANHDLIQQQIKAGTKSYKFSMPYGSVPMVDKATGELKMAESYEHTKLHDTHDYLLPTDAAKEKAIDAWIKARRGAKITTEMVNRSRGAGSRSGAYDHMPRRQYKDAPYSSKHINPVKGLLQQLSGGSAAYGTKSALEKQAAARLEAEQMQAIRRAGTANEAIQALMPLAKVGGGAENKSATFPEKALALAWARARHLGGLDDKVERNGHADYAYAGRAGRSAHAALLGMARVSGHNDLAEAMAETAERHGLSRADVDTLHAMAHWNPSKRSLAHIRKVAERMGILGKTIGELRDLNLGGNFAPAASYGYGWDARQRNDKTLETVLNELQETAK